MLFQDAIFAILHEKSHGASPQTSLTPQAALASCEVASSSSEVDTSSHRAPPPSLEETMRLAATIGGVRKGKSTEVPDANPYVHTLRELSADRSREPSASPEVDPLLPASVGGAPTQEASSHAEAGAEIEREEGRYMYERRLAAALQDDDDDGEDASPGWGDAVDEDDPVRSAHKHSMAAVDRAMAEARCTDAAPGDGLAQGLL